MAETWVQIYGGQVAPVPDGVPKDWREIVAGKWVSYGDWWGRREVTNRDNGRLIQEWQLQGWQK